MFRSVDVDQEGTLNKNDLKYFTAEVLRGITGDQHESVSDFLERYKIVFGNLDDHVGEFRIDDLKSFMRELLKT